MKKRLFCLLLVMALVSSMGMTAFAEPDAPAEPAPQETVTETTTTETAPAPDAEQPADDPAPQAPEAPTEPAPETPTEPAPEVPAEPTEPETTDEPDTTEEPGISLTSLAPEISPISNGFDLTITAVNETLDMQEAYDCWAKVANGSRDWGSLSGFATIQITEPESPESVEWHVVPSVSGGVGWDAGPGTLCVTVTENEGKTLRLMGGSDILSGRHYGDSFTVDVYATVTFGGAAQDTEHKTITFKNNNPDSEASDPSNTPEPEKSVLLHVINGSFVDGDASYEGISDKASVEVTFADPAARTLPELPTATRTNGTFDGWYTQAPIEAQVTSEDGTYSYWHTVKVNGVKLQAGDPVPADVHILYAVFTDKAVEDDSDKLVTFYLDWNGIGGLWGPCLTCTRSYDNGQAKFTAKDALVNGLNDYADNGGGKPSDTTWEALNKFWSEGRTFNGYEFKGWATTPTAESPDVTSDYDLVKNGMTFYAVWSKDGESSQTFERVDEAAGPLEFLQILGNLSPSKLGRTHANKGASFGLSLHRSPVRATVNQITWTVKVSKQADTIVEMLTNKPEELELVVDPAGDPVTKEVAAEGFNLSVTASGYNLTITDEDGAVYYAVVSASATTEGGKTVTANAEANVSFYHDAGVWQETKEATCMDGGEETTHCTTCGAEMTRKTVPLEHHWEFQVTKEAKCTEEGLEEKVCTRCGGTYREYLDEMTKRYGPQEYEKVIPPTGHTYENSYCQVCGGECMMGDVSGDDRVSLQDVNLLFYHVAGDDSATLTGDRVADVNADGKLSLVDVNMLFYYVAGADVTLG